MKRIVLLLCYLASASALAMPLTEGWELLKSDPKRIIEIYEPLTNLPEHENNERLLLLGFAYYEHQKRSVITPIINQLENQDLPPARKAQFFELKGRWLVSIHTKFEPALEAFDAGLATLDGHSTPLANEVRLKLLITKGSLLSYLHRIGDAIRYFNQARQQAIALSDNAALALIEQHKGKAWRRGDKPMRAIEHYRAAIALAKYAADPTFEGDIQLELARLHRSTRDYDKALSHAEAAANNFEHMDSKHALATALQELGDIYRDKENFGLSLHYLLLAQSLSKELESTIGLAITHQKLGMTYLKDNTPELALHYLTLAQKAFEQRQHEHYLTFNTLTLALASNKSGQWQMTVDLLTSKLESDYFKRQPEDHLEALKLLAEANWHLGHNETAWSQLNMAVELSDVEKLQEKVAKTNQISQQQLRHRIQKQNQELISQNELVSQLESQRFLWLLLILLPLGYSIWAQIKYKRQKQINRGVITSSIRHDDTQNLNRHGLYQQIEKHNFGYLALLKVNQLTEAELELGQHQSTLYRRYLLTKLGQHPSVIALFEISTELVALQLTDERPIESTVTALFDILIQEKSACPLDDPEGCAGPFCAGVIQLPFQPGALMRLPPRQALELTQLALWTANDLAKRTRRDQYVLLQPVSLGAQVLDPTQLYKDAIQGIDHGVIRAVCGEPDATLNYPEGNKYSMNHISQSNS